MAGGCAARDTGIRGAGAARTSAFAALALVLAAAAFLAAPSRPAPAVSGSPSSWKGYRSLLVDFRADESALLEALEDAGAWPAISASTQPVLVSDWSRPVATTLSEARRSLIPGDPRLDAYIARLGKYFEARVGDEEYRVIYLPESRFRGGKAIAKALEELGVEFLLPETLGASLLDSHPSASFILSAAIMSIAIALSSLMGRSSSLRVGGFRPRPYSRALESAALRAAIAAPFAAIAWKGGWASLAAALWALALLDLADPAEFFMSEAAHGAGLKRALLSAIGASPPGIVVLVAAIGATTAQSSLSPAVAAGLGSSAAAAAFVSRLPFAPRRRFSPVAIAGRRYRPSPASALRAALACAAILLAAAASLAGGGKAPRSEAEAGIAYPLPLALPGAVKPLPREAADRLGEESADDRLPGLASWLAHVAFQESIPYARLGEERADPFASLVLPSIEGPGPRVDFDDEWARAAYRGLNGASIETMLAAQGGAAIGALSRPSASPPRNGPPLAPMGALLYILLLIPPLVRIAASKPTFRAASSRGVRQEA